MCRDHGDRRRLARLAAAGGWSVRRLEREARADGSSSTRREAHPDQLAFGRALGDALQNALGRDVEVAPMPRRLPRDPGSPRSRRRGGASRARGGAGAVVLGDRRAPRTQPTCCPPKSATNPKSSHPIVPPSPALPDGISPQRHGFSPGCPPTGPGRGAKRDRDRTQNRRNPGGWGDTAVSFGRKGGTQPWGTPVMGGRSRDHAPPGVEVRPSRRESSTNRMPRSDDNLPLQRSYVEQRIGQLVGIFQIERKQLAEQVEARALPTTDGMVGLVAVADGGRLSETAFNVWTVGSQLFKEAGCPTSNRVDFNLSEYARRLWGANGKSGTLRRRIADAVTELLKTRVVVMGDRPVHAAAGRGRDLGAQPPRGSRSAQRTPSGVRGGAPQRSRGSRKAGLARALSRREIHLEHGATEMACGQRPPRSRRDPRLRSPARAARLGEAHLGAAGVLHGLAHASPRPTGARRRPRQPRCDRLRRTVAASP